MTINIDLRLGDCLKILPQLETDSIDAVITDLPYGVGIKYASFDDTKDSLKTLIDKAIPEIRRLAGTVLIFCGNGNQHLYPPPDWTLCWHIPAGNGYNTWGFTTWQPILAYGKPYRKKRESYPDSYSMSPTAEKSEHPCPKPIKLMRLIIERNTTPGATILDPFMGSGTTGVACVQTGRNFIGLEIDLKYFAIAKKRIDFAMSQGSLFNDFQKTKPISLSLL